MLNGITWNRTVFDIETVGYHLPFQHNELFHQTRRAVPTVEVYPYSITNPMFLLLTVSLL